MCMCRVSVLCWWLASPMSEWWLRTPTTSHQSIHPISVKKLTASNSSVSSVLGAQESASARFITQYQPGPWEEGQHQPYSGWLRAFGIQRKG